MVVAWHVPEIDNVP
jgi:hypothetical protein